jgi:hypothetical protein
MNKPLVEVLSLEDVRTQLLRHDVHMPLFEMRSLERTRQAILQLGAAGMLTKIERHRLHNRFERKLIPHCVEEWRKGKATSKGAGKRFEVGVLE